VWNFGRRPGAPPEWRGPDANVFYYADFGSLAPRVPVAADVVRPRQC